MVSMFVLQIAAVGIGIGEIIFRYPAVFEVFKYIGAAFLFYLAYLFFKSSGPSADEQDANVGFREGALLQFFNFKALSVPLIMFTQFIEPQTSSWGQILGLSVALFILIVTSLWVWTIGGSFLKSFFQSEFGRKWQGKTFGILLMLVAIWMLIR
ncbi:MAG: threonine/homoserine/homoserine lactone efflux protein [Candidatus Promineifilaceae bacterium]